MQCHKRNKMRKKNVENFLNHKQSVFCMYFHFQNITVSFFFHAVALSTVTHYLMSIQSLDNTWTRITGQLFFFLPPLVIIKLCRYSAEWPVSSLRNKWSAHAAVHTSCPSTVSTFLICHRLWEYAVQALKSLCSQRAPWVAQPHLWICL